MTVHSTALAKLGGYLESRKARIQAMLPAESGITPGRLIRTALLSVDENPVLLRCTPESLYKAIITSARYGLEIGGPLAQSYIVPYKDAAKLVIGYRGLIALVLRTGAATQVVAEAVREGDHFERTMGIGGKITHIASKDPKRDEKPITHVYCQYLLANGNIVDDVMTTAEVNRHAEQYSKAVSKADSPWNTAWLQMALKTVLRRPVLRGFVPVTLTDADRRVFEDSSGAERFVEASEVSRITTTRVQPDETLATETELLTDAEMEAALERESIQSE